MSVNLCPLLTETAETYCLFQLDSSTEPSLPCKCILLLCSHFSPLQSIFYQLYLQWSFTIIHERYSVALHSMRWSSNCALCCKDVSFCQTTGNVIPPAALAIASWPQCDYAAQFFFIVWLITHIKTLPSAVSSWTPENLKYSVISRKHQRIPHLSWPQNGDNSSLATEWHNSCSHVLGLLAGTVQLPPLFLTEV
jgi:hypothetical protein